MSFILNPPAGWGRYQAGQFTTIEATIDGQPYQRHYSLVTIPPFTTPAITVKRTRGGIVSNHLHNTIRRGGILRCTPPQGHFTSTHVPAAMHQNVFIAGGSGIVPITALLQEQLQQATPRQATLIYASRHSRGIIYRKHLDALVERYPKRLQLHYFISQDAMWQDHRGRITPARLLALITNVQQNNYFLCAPQELMQTTRKTLRMAGVPSPQIRQVHHGNASYHGPARRSEAICPAHGANHDHNGASRHYLD